jgi:serine/threonine protein phosphatase PrpC
MGSEYQPFHGEDEIATRWEGNEERATLFEYREGIVAVVANGAGGMRGGADAAQAVVDAVRRVGWASDVRTWVSLLSCLDREVCPGQTTAVVVAIGSNQLAGASVGDSGAWWFDATGKHDLTRGQHRKPLLGSGEAEPVGFLIEGSRPGTLLLGVGWLVEVRSF